MYFSALRISVLSPSVLILSALSQSGVQHITQWPAENTHGEIKVRRIPDLSFRVPSGPGTCGLGPAGLLPLPIVGDVERVPPEVPLVPGVVRVPVTAGREVERRLEAFLRHLWKSQKYSSQILFYVSFFFGNWLSVTYSM